MTCDTSKPSSASSGGPTSHIVPWLQVSSSLAWLEDFIQQLKPSLDRDKARSALYAQWTAMHGSDGKSSTQVTG